MTTATLARGPPLSVGHANFDDDGDNLMEGLDEDESVENAPTSNSRKHANPSRIPPQGRRGSSGLVIAEEQEGEGDSDAETGDYSNGEAVDYSSCGTTGKPGSSDEEREESQEGDRDRDEDREDDMDGDEARNGSIQSYDDYQHLTERNGRNGLSMSSGGSLTYTGAGKNLSMEPPGSNGAVKNGSVGKNGKSFVCDICMKTFSNAANMRRHRVRHSGIKPFECRFCQKRFFRKDHMREHMNHKHNNTQMECYFCQQVFDKEKDLFQHVTRDHEVNPRELHCHYCSFSATTIGRYLWHLTTSHPRKNSHYLDGNGEGLSMSMAPYSVDNDYDSETSPTAVPSRPAKSASAVSTYHPAFELAQKRSEYETYSKREREREREEARSPSETGAPANGARKLSSYYDENPLAAVLAGATTNGSSRSKSVRYVSLLPSHLMASGAADSSSTGAGAEDLSSYPGTPIKREKRESDEMKYEAEDLSNNYPSDNVRLAYALFPKKMNGNAASSTANVAAQALAAARNAGMANAALPASSGSSNRRKNKAPVRMAASPDNASSTADTTNGTGPSTSSSEHRGVKREYPYPEESPRNGDSHPTTNYLEELMSHSNRDRPSQSTNAPAPEDLSRSVIQRPKTSPALAGLNGLSPALREAVVREANGTTAGNSAAPGGVEGDTEHKCPYCLIVYPDNVMYLLHKMLHSKNQPYRCAICHNQYPNRYEFYGHVVNHRP